MVVELVMGGEVGGRVEARRWTGLPLEKLRNVVEVVEEAGRVVSWGLGVARRVVEVVEVVGKGWGGEGKPWKEAKRLAI